MSEQTPYSFDPPIETAPRTVVSLVPSFTETLFDLNLGNRLIGRTEYCVLPADKVGAIPTLGGPKNPDVQRIIQRKPDLVLANYEENRKPDVEALRAAGIPVWVTFVQTVSDVFVLLWKFMELFDEASMVPRVRLIEQIYERLEVMAETRTSSPPGVFVPIWYDPLMTANRHTFLHDVLRVCGGRNVFAERDRQFPLKADLGQGDPLPEDDTRRQGRDTRYPRVSMEEVAAAQPDIILLPSEPFEFTEAHIPAFQALDVPAAKENRIYLVDGTWLTWYGTRLAHTFHELPSKLRWD